MKITPKNAHPTQTSAHLAHFSAQVVFSRADAAKVANTIASAEGHDKVLRRR